LKAISPRRWRDERGTLLAHYEQIADAPDANWLRVSFLIWRCAEAVPQYPKDEPAVELLADCEAAKTAALKAGKARQHLTKQCHLRSQSACRIQAHGLWRFKR
jgi:hypothetical protein